MSSTLYCQDSSTHGPSQQMRDWRKYWKDRTVSLGDSFDDELREVEKTLFGKPVPKDQIDLIIESIRRQLKLSESDFVFDIGCANGLLTARMAAYVGEICGIDISEKLIQAAQRRYDVHNCRFVVQDITTFEPILLAGARPCKFFAYEVLQHFTMEETRSLLITCLNTSRDGMIFFAGSIPDLELIKKFYNTPERWQLYKNNISQNSEQIGQWWRREEIHDICSDLKLKCATFDQNPDLYTAHYRFDAVIHG